MPKTESIPENGTHKILWDIEIQTVHQIQKIRPIEILTKKCHIVDLFVPADYSVKIKESEKRDKCFNIARDLRKLWNMRVTVSAFVIGALGRVSKILGRGIEELETGGQIETTQSTALLWSARILRRVLET